MIFCYLFIFLASLNCTHKTQEPLRCLVDHLSYINTFHPPNNTWTLEFFLFCCSNSPGRSQSKNIHFQHPEFLSWVSKSNFLTLAFQLNPENDDIYDNNNSSAISTSPVLFCNAARPTPTRLITYVQAVHSPLWPLSSSAIVSHWLAFVW